MAAAEALPWELDGLADLVTVHFPWGSLLRGLLEAEPAVMTGLTRVMRHGATLSLLVSSTARDRGAGRQRAAWSLRARFDPVTLPPSPGRARRAGIGPGS